MPLPEYGLLRGNVINVLPFQKIGDHYNIELSAAGQSYRIVIDVYSTLKGSPKATGEDNPGVWDIDRLLLFYLIEPFDHPVLTACMQTAAGYTPAKNLPASLHLDYLRTQPALFPVSEMKVVPPTTAAGDGNDLNDDFNRWIQKAIQDPGAEAFAFGSFFDNRNSRHPDHHLYFHPNPEMGIHDIHMNQGDTGSEAANNGVGQDGALLIRYSDNTWVGIFLRFQNQSIDTDDQGNPT
jgi:uncharacterized protein YukJ